MKKRWKEKMGDTGNGRKKESKSEIVKRKNLHRVTQRSSEVTEENHEKRKTKNEKQNCPV